MTDPDREVATTAHKCIQAIEAGKDPILLPAVVRQLVREHPEGAMEALLGFLPFAADADLEEEIWFGLDTLAKIPGQPLQSLEEMLHDKQPVRRAAVAYLFARRGDALQRQAAATLLADPDALVRLRVAQGLLGTKETAAVPVLIGLLDGCSIELSWQAEEMLQWVAGDDAPEATVGTGSSERREECRRAWQQWWEKTKSTLDLTNVYHSSRRPGLILMRTDPKLFSLDPKANERKPTAWLCGCDGKPRWRVAVPLGLVQVLPGPRLLTMEPVAQRITERNLDGAIVRQCRVNLEALPSAHVLRGGVLDLSESWQFGRRLANGNTFVAGFARAAEITPEGKELYNRSFGDRDARCTHPQRLPNGHVLCLLERDKRRGVAEFDPLTGALLGEVFFAGWSTEDRWYDVTALPNGHYLVASARRGGILEIGAAGQTCWQCSSKPNIVMRLRNGNLLGVTGGGLMDLARQPKPVVQIYPGPGLIEIDPSGRIVWEVVRAGTACFPVCFGVVRLGFDEPRPRNLDVTSPVYRAAGLRSRDLMVRLKSAYELQRLGSKAAGVLPDLIAALGDPNEFVRRNVAETLQGIGPSALPELLKAAKDKRPAVRATAVGTLGSFITDGEVVVSFLLEMAKDEDVLVRRSAIRALKVNLFIRRKQTGTTAGLTDTEIHLIVAALVKALNDKDPAKGSLARSVPEISVPQLAARTLSDMGPQAKAAIPALIEKLKAEDLRLRGNAVAALRFIGPEAKVAVPDLLQALEAKDVHDLTEAFYIRQAVLVTLDRLGYESPMAVPILTQALLDKRLQSNARQMAAETLGKMGRRAKTAVSALVEAQKDENDTVRSLATAALGKIRHETRIP